MRTKLLILLVFISILLPASAVSADDGVVVVDDPTTETPWTLEDYAVIAAWAGPDPTLAPARGTTATQYDPSDYTIPSDNSPNKTDDAGNGSGGVCGNGVARSHKVKTWTSIPGQNSVPLRCGRWDGTIGWGYRKLTAKNRWNPWWDGMIAYTMRNADVINQQGTSITYKSYYFMECDPPYRMVVVTETKTYGDGKMGLITAYMDYL